MQRLWSADEADKLRELVSAIYDIVWDDAK